MVFILLQSLYISVRYSRPGKKRDLVGAVRRLEHPAPGAAAEGISAAAAAATAAAAAAAAAADAAANGLPGISTNAVRWAENKGIQISLIFYSCTSGSFSVVSTPIFGRKH